MPRYINGKKVDQVIVNKGMQAIYHNQQVFSKWVKAGTVLWNGNKAFDGTTGSGTEYFAPGDSNVALTVPLRKAKNGIQLNFKQMLSINTQYDPSHDYLDYNQQSYQISDVNVTAKIPTGTKGNFKFMTYHENNWYATMLDDSHFTIGTIYTGHDDGNSFTSNYFRKQSTYFESQTFSDSVGPTEQDDHFLILASVTVY
ncbi:MAG TPA: hypothetical protein DDW71_00345 [Lactobacillus sp.]|nr:hypothetical protein [Lactobacillus sp.]